MIKNIILDAGGVMMNVKVMDLIRAYKPNLLEMKAMVSVMADSEEWDNWNKGNYRDVREMVDVLKVKYPKYSGMMEKAFLDDWGKYMKPDTGMWNTVKALKKAGYRVYFLADIPHELYDVVMNSEYAQYIDGGVYSFEEHTRKPDRKMYDALIARYGLIPQECVMIDDNANYLKPAAALGMHGIRFTDASACTAKLKALIEAENGKKE